MTDLNNRQWSLTLGTKRISSDQSAFISMDFEVKKTVTREPNTCTMRVANLSESSRRVAEQSDDLQIELRAGYSGMTDLIFSGQARDVWTERDGPEQWLNVEAEDAGTSYRNGRVGRSFEPGVSLQTVINACAEAMGVGIGNSAQVSATAELEGGGSQFAEGYTVDGVAWRELNIICRSAGLRWSVQNGVLQLREAGQPAERRSIRLSPGTGLIGQPQRGRGSRQERRTVEARSLLIPGMYPGRIIVLESDSVSGNFLLRSVRFIGKTMSTDWYADLEIEDY
jgi:hypothetical protein